MENLIDDQRKLKNIGEGTQLSSYLNKKYQDKEYGKGKYKELSPAKIREKTLENRQKWEGKINVNKSKKFDEVFCEFLKKYACEIKGKQFELFLNLAKEAHNTKLTSKELTSKQSEYQNGLKRLGIPLAGIMNFHRSVGFEFEFSNFERIDSPRTSSEDKEILRSHVLLAKSSKISGVFDMGFGLETDSYNTLELVTPPFLFLISEDTSSIIKEVYNKYEAASLELRKKVDSTSKKEELSKQDLLSKKLDIFTEVGFGSDWEWAHTEEMAKLLCATSQYPKHTSQILGQINISVSADEIIEMIDTLMVKGEQDQITVKGNVSQERVPIKVYNEVIGELRKLSPSKKLDGAIGLYAKSVSSVVGIPSVLYRNETNERPHEEYNYATSIKEALGLWTKDFSHAILADYFGNKLEDKEEFIHLIDKTAGVVEETILKAINEDAEKMTKQIVEERSKYLKDAKNKMHIINEKVTKEIGPLPENKDNLIAKEQFEKIILDYNLRKKEPVVKLFKSWMTDTENELKELRELYEKRNARFFMEVKQELNQMIELLLRTLKWGLTQPERTSRQDKESFGNGLGVRKETYLAPLDGARGLRIAEIRSRDDLAELEDRINSKR